MTPSKMAQWLAVTFGTAVMYRLGARRVDVLDARIDRVKERCERAVNEAKRIDRARDRAAAMQMLLHQKFEMVLPILLSRLVGSAGPGTEFLGESLLMEVLESLSEQQLTAIAHVLDDTQRLALFSLYQLYRDKWKKDHPEEETASSTEDGENNNGAPPEATSAEEPESEPGATAEPSATPQ